MLAQDILEKLVGRFQTGWPLPNWLAAKCLFDRVFTLPFSLQVGLRHRQHKHQQGSGIHKIQSDATRECD